MKCELTYQERIAGLLLGSAVGDAIGLPTEGMSAERIARWWPGEVQHRFVFGRGMMSDDTEHAAMTAQALIVAAGDVEKFRRSLAWKFRWWFLGLPAGVGLATARACIRLWFGVSPERSGVYSAGNGPAMRSAVIGAAFADDMLKRREFVAASTRMTHTDMRAETAALAVAEAAAWIVRGDLPDPFGARLPELSEDGEWLRVCGLLADGLANGRSVKQFAETLDLKTAVTGYAFHTVPVAVFAWQRHRGDYRETVQSVIRCGGDTDTTAAIAGSLAGCDVGREGITAQWQNNLIDWPRSKNWLCSVAGRLTDDEPKPVRLFWPGIIPRNLFFLVAVLAHGVRRMFPPY
ncbi:MAG: ADP-ribosylglycohydrolase family protein [Limisphaerales bacterium]